MSLNVPSKFHLLRFLSKLPELTLQHITHSWYEFWTQLCGCKICLCRSKGPDICPYLHICSVIPPSTAGLWQQVHQQFTRTFFNGKEEVSDFSGVRGWPFFVPLENRAWTVSRSTTPRADTTVPRTIGEITAPGGTALPRRARAVRNPAVSPCSSAVTSSRVNGQTGDWLRSPLASTPLRVWGGSGRGRGRGYTEKGEDYTPRGGGWKSETLPAWRGRRFGHSTPD